MIRLLQKQSDLDLHCLLRTFWQATSFKILEHISVSGLSFLGSSFTFMHVLCVRE